MHKVISKRRIAGFDNIVLEKIDDSVFEEIKDRNNKKIDDISRPEKLTDSDFWRKNWVSSEG